MGEGAIEGVAADYAMADKYAVDFKYSRFGKGEAKPRDAKKLSGKRVGKERQNAWASSGVSADVLPSAEDMAAWKSMATVEAQRK